eukprot:CAMPEP_0194439104 /NCGR_PEP_ID=MMETSP0176-20130528/108607_1 /TAXON_ID=216777 /ORGANISM="Proboscia alata, Strain PI-D3" /LENGTH=67 /DNA_ID=CAMNT_0039261963 /DNA_START=77 /DNA_END=277 /DNA_ORIENTATION=+
MSMIANDLVALKLASTMIAILGVAALFQTNIVRNLAAALAGWRNPRPSNENQVCNDVRCVRCRPGSS